MRRVLLAGGLQPAPQRARSSWRAFLHQHAASALACDLLTVETAFLQRIYVLFFISLATRRIEYIACTSNPGGAWTAQQARNLVMQLGGDQPFRLLIHDRDTKFGGAFDEVFHSEGLNVIRTPVQAPNANAYAERWVRTVRADCLDRNPRPRPPPSRTRAPRLPRALQRAPAPPRARPDRRDPTPPNRASTTRRVHRRDLLGGLIHEYRAAA